MAAACLPGCSFLQESAVFDEESGSDPIVVEDLTSIPAPALYEEFAHNHDYSNVPSVGGSFVYTVVLIGPYFC